ncbi:MAG: hypothetical protein ACXAC8_09670 [Candidatus Hodarchaeales archaeon]|jgi:hypothetical protein
MQLPTHLIAGIVIQSVVNSLIPTPDWRSVLLVIIIAFFSHFIFDALARITYHPPERIDDIFWLGWHSFVYLSGFVILLMFFGEFWLGMLFANIVDLWDWYFLRKIASRKQQPDWGKKFYIHQFVDKIRSTFFLWLPNLTYDRKGILPELTLIISWFSIILLPQLL